jgi:TonB-linked SusC/RagA family outer membrane protein
MTLRQILPRLVPIAAVVLAASAHAQAQPQVTVRGTVVVGETTEPVPNANVVVAGTRLGTQTNERGEFTLRVPGANDTLVVTRLGYSPARLPLAGQTLVTVRLTRTAVTLSEIVTVGYGTQKRSDITGSVTSITPEHLENKPNRNLAQALEGALPGVNVTQASGGTEGTTNIQIRGPNSISASTSPLIVVDGIPYESNLNELNPSDIQSIEVLKDASATAIYGSRGSNGVLLVTTKRGTTGKPRFSYSGYGGASNYVNLPHIMGAQEFADFKCVRTRTSAAQACTATLTATEQKNLAAGATTDWLDFATRSGSQQQHDLSVAGGSEDTRYFLAGSLYDAKGIALNDQLRRYTVRGNLEQKVSSWLTLGTNTQVSRIDRGGRPVSFNAAFLADPLLTPYDANGNVATVIWPEDPTTANPLEPTLATDDDVTNRLFTSNYFQANVPKVKGLTFRMNGGLNLSSRKAGLYYGRNTQTGLAVNGQAISGNDTRDDWTWENILQYSRTFGRHNLGLTGLYSRQKNTFERDTVFATGFPNDVLGYRSNVPLLAVPGDSVIQSQLVSQMGRVNYGYDERYLATFTVRRDGSSRFGANHKYGVFPSAALAWNASNEKFFPWKGTVNTAKVRLTYGKSGNEAVPAYRTLAQLDDRSYLTGDVAAPGYFPSTLGNPDLRWETTTQLNLGLDVGLWNDRVRLTADAYDSKTQDLLLRRAISPVHGITSVLQNIGKVGNRGVEAQLSTVNVDRGGFQWRSDFNISHNDNRIIDLYGDGVDDLVNGWFYGQPINVNFGYKFAGVWQTADSVSGAIAKGPQPTAKPGDVRILDANGDNKIDPSDRVIIGSLEPKYSAGLTNTFRYKGVSLSAYVYTVQGVMRSDALFGSNQVFSDVRRNTLSHNYWSPTNPTNDYPANSNTSNPLAVAFYQNASFVRLKDLTLAYDLPTRLTRAVSAQSLRLYVNGRNLWTHTDWQGLDPELNNQQAIPLERIITAGVNVSF